MTRGESPFDVIVQGGDVVDGTGATRVRADVAISGDTIAFVGDAANASARVRIDASGKIVCPGFIDSHAHSDISLLARPDALAKIRQGVTTDVTGNCGFSAFPLSDATKEMARTFSAPVLGHPEIEWDWHDTAGYFEKLAIRGSATNVASLVGHGTLRNAVLGFDRRAPTPAELERMQRLLEQALEQGAVGLSTGLCYAPGVFAATDEIVELCRVVAGKGGLYATHLRDQSDRLEQAVEEAIDIGGRSGARVLVSHHKAAGSRNWGKVNRTLAMLDAANAAGTRTFCDVYPYIAGQSTMLSILPPWVIEGGVDAMLERLARPDVRRRIEREFDTGLPGWENRAGALGWQNVIISSVVSSGNRDLAGLSVQAAASLRGKRELEFLFDLLGEERGVVGRVSVQCSEQDVTTVLTHERTMIGSDGMDVDNPHPRQYGCFPRVLGEYVRERQALSLESAVHKMTGLTAAVFGFRDVGTVAAGKRADIVVFDPESVRDRGTFADPAHHPDGIEWVLVAGQTAVARGEFTGVCAGKALRHA